MHQLIHKRTYQLICKKTHQRIHLQTCQLIHMQTRQLIHFKRINLFRLRRCGTESSRPTSSGVRRSWWSITLTNSSIWPSPSGLRLPPSIPCESFTPKDNELPILTKWHSRESLERKYLFAVTVIVRSHVTLKRSKLLRFSCKKNFWPSKRRSLLVIRIFKLFTLRPKMAPNVVLINSSNRKPNLSLLQTYCINVVE